MGATKELIINQTQEESESLNLELQIFKN